jgi:hypothetical protein
MCADLSIEFCGAIQRHIPHIAAFPKTGNVTQAMTDEHDYRSAVP